MKIVISGLIVLALCQGARAADSRWAECATDLLPAEAVSEALGDFSDLLSEKVAAARVVEPDYEVLQTFLQFAAEEGMDVFDLLGSTAFVIEGSNCAMLLRRERLTQMDREFDLHSLFMVDAPRRSHADPPLKMQFLLVVNGEMFVGYDGSARVYIEEYDTVVSTGTFRFEPLIAMRLDAQGLNELRTFKSPTATPTALKGPYGARILRLRKTGEGRIRVTLRLLFSFAREMPLAAITRR